LVKRGMAVERQKPLTLVYGDVSLDCAYRIDLLVEDAVVVEVKSVARLDSVHEAQLLSYLTLSKKTVGLLVNFNVKLLARDGIKRRVNGFPQG
jgi:GxxExxY protein